MKLLIPLVAIAAVAVAATTLHDEADRPGGPFPARRTVEAAWTEALAWSFSQGAHPEGWGWGRRAFVDNTLELTSTDEGPAYYFVPVVHERDFVLETQVQLVSAAGDGPLGAHLDTRDSIYMASVTGAAIYGSRPDVYLRHQVDLRPTPSADPHQMATDVELGTWHTLRVAVENGRYTVSVDDNLVHAGPADVASSTYSEPSLAVENGTARFRYLKVMTRPVVPPGVPPAAIPGGHPEVAKVPPTGWIRAMLIGLYAVIAIVCIYMVRHYLFTLNRLFGRQRHPYLDVDTADWPQVTVLVPAHNEEPVIGEILQALLQVDYPADRFRILPVNDRSEDRTEEIIEELARTHPGRITPFHRREGKPGKAAALQDAMEVVQDDIVLVFDADYIPGHGIIKQLVAPFFDPEVGAVMGRVVPHNVGQNLITRVLDLERAGGYQVDQQARMNLHLVPQYGGTVGGVRRGALLAAGGWRDDSLAEDTDATYRLLLAGWKIVYQNRAECYEQVPNTWPMRMRQLLRWARGHNQVLIRYAHRLILNRNTRFSEKLDALLLLNVYLMSPVLILGWGLGLVLWFLGVSKPGLIIILAVTSYSTLGNFAIFFEIATAAYLDGSRERIRLLPFVLPAFLVSLMSITRAALTQIFYRRPGEEVLWHKTEHNNRGHTWT